MRWLFRFFGFNLRRSSFKSKQVLNTTEGGKRTVPVRSFRLPPSVGSMLTTCLPKNMEIYNVKVQNLLAWNDP